MRGESTVGPATRVEVVTTGVLVRRLQRDPELAGTGAVVLDECHERHLDTDLALAFGVDVRAALRPDLLLLAMSATAQAERLAAALGGVPVVEASGALHQVEAVWCPPPAPVAPPHGLRVDPRLLDHVADVVRRAHAETAGDLLVFLPGAGEVGAVAGRLRDLDVVPLHGRLPAAAQDAALRQRDGRRVVLATVGRREQPDRAGRPRRRRRRARPRAAHRPGPRARLARHRARLPRVGAPAGRPGRARGAGPGLPLLVGGRPRAAAGARRAGGRDRRPDRLRARARLLGRAGRARAGAARPAAAGAMEVAPRRCTASARSTSAGR